MQDIILLKQGEIVLKGLNKKYFEQKLISNVKRRLRSLGEFDVTCTQSTIYVEPKSDDIDMDETQQAMTKVFGIAAVVRAAACDKTPEAMAQKAIEYMAEAMRAKPGASKVETRRADKAFPMTSIEVSQYVGGELAEAFPETAVDVHSPELTVHVEVRERAATSTAPRCSARAVCRRLRRHGGNAPLRRHRFAGIDVYDRQARRTYDPGAFLLVPYTSELAKQKVLDLAKGAHRLLRAAHRGSRAVHAHPDRDPRQVPRGIFHAHHAPVYDAHRAGGRRPKRRQGARHGRKISVRSPRRRWKRSAAPRPSRVCPCCARSSALTKKRSSASPARSARSSSPRCPTKTAARCSRRATPHAAPHRRRGGSGGCARYRRSRRRGDGRHRARAL